MKLTLTLMVSLALFATGAIGQTTPPAGTSSPSPIAIPPATLYTPPTKSERIRYSLGEAFGPTALLGVAINAAFDQAYNRPEEWRQGGAGFGRRFGNRFGQNVVQESVEGAVAAAMHVDTRYQRCQCTGLLRRTSHVLVSGFTAKTASGKTTISVPRFAGAFAGGFTTLAWAPDRYGSQYALRYSLGGFLSSIGNNFFREFFRK